MLKRNKPQDLYAKQARRNQVTRWTMLTVVAAGIVVVIVTRPFGGPAVSSSPFDQPSSEVSSRTAETDEPPADDGSAQLIERTSRFTEAYFAYNWLNTPERIKTIKPYGEKSWLATVQKAEQDIGRKAMIKNHTVRTVTTVTVDDYDIQATSASTDITVTVEETSNSVILPVTLNFSGTVWWKYDKTTKSWLVTQTDPI